MFNDGFMPYAIIVSLFQLLKGLMPWQQQCRVSPSSSVESLSARCSPGLFPAIRSNFQPRVRRNIPGPPDAIGQWGSALASADGLASNSPGQRGLMLYFWTELFLQTLSLLRSKIAQSPFVEPSFGKMFLDLHSRHEKGKEALVRAG